MHTPRHPAIGFIPYLSVVLFLLVPAASFAGSALQFVTVPPCRIADTRNPVGPFGGPSIAGRTVRDFPIQQSTCNIPTDAAAYSLNITVVPPGALGFVTVWPSGQQQPLASTLNSFDGRTKANAAIVVAGNSGAISVYASDTTDVVLDINGYFISSNTNGLAFYDLTPCRVLDTRNPNSPLGGPYLSANVARPFPLLASSCNIPSAAQAYSLNVTAVPRGPLYFLSVWPDQQTWPGVSTLNAPTGTAVANGAIVPAGPNGNIQVLASNDTDMLVDINGYFAPPGTDGLSLFPTSPCRVIDTRNQQGNFKGELTINVIGSPCGVPNQGQAYVLNATVVPPGPLGFLSLWPDLQSQPLVSTLNAYDGAVTSNMAIVPTTNGSIDAYASDLTPLILDISSYFAPPSFLTITTKGLPGGALTTFYDQTVNAIGGLTPYTWSITQGNLPNGLGLDPNSGMISGIPTTLGNFSFTVQVQDSNLVKATANFNISIEATGVTMTTSGLPVGNLNANYSATLGATGGTTPYTWTINSGALPGGLSLNGSTGVISGTPSTTGTYTFNLEVRDVDNNFAGKTLSIIVGSGAANSTLSSGTYAIAFSGHNTNGSSRFRAGSFVADGNGNITSGYFDQNASDNGITSSTIVSGNYSIEANGLGVLSVSGTNADSVVLAVAVPSNGETRIIQFLRNDGTGTEGSGVIAKQDPTKFSLASLTGPFAFRSSGVDSGLNRISTAGAFSLNGSTTIANGEFDTDDNGVTQNSTFTGTLGNTVNSVTGRGTLQLSINSKPVNIVFYVVSANRIIMMGIDPIQTNSLVLGTALSQSATNFDDTALSGNALIEIPGVEIVNSVPVANATLGLITADGKGNASVTLDQNNGGTMSQTTLSGTYTVSANGRVTLSGGFGNHTPVFYLAGTNTGFLVGTDSSAISGTVEPQSGSSFSNASLSGNYRGGSLSPVAGKGNDEVDSAVADGAGNLSATSYSSDQMTTNLFPATYAVNSTTGRILIYDNKSQNRAIGYVVSATNFVVLTTDTSGHIIVLQH